MRHYLLAAAIAGCGAHGAWAGRTVERACEASAQSAASPALCGCIQAVADQTLATPDQRVAASLFADPDKAQLLRTSDSVAGTAFWHRYSTFAAAAEASCGG